MHVADRTFLITGGASGLGAACARRLVERGGRVVAVDLQADALAQLAGELGPAALPFAADVTDAAAIAAAVQLAGFQFGALHGLIHCAGVAPAARILGRGGPHDLEMFRRTVEVNLIGTFNCLRLAASAMSGNEPDAEGERGIAVLTSSVAAFDGQLGQAAYAASKGGVASLTLPAARELAAFGIRVAAIAPGIFDTPLMAGMSDEVRQSLAAQAPFPQRLGRPEEFAALVEQVIENPMLNGCVLRLDGALRMGPR